MNKYLIDCCARNSLQRNINSIGNLVWDCRWKDPVVGRHAATSKYRNAYENINRIQNPKSESVQGVVAVIASQRIDKVGLVSAVNPGTTSKEPAEEKEAQQI